MVCVQQQITDRCMMDACVCLRTCRMCVRVCACVNVCVLSV